MSCYHPNKMTRHVDPGTGNVFYTFDGSAAADNPLTLAPAGQMDNGVLLVPCGHCIGCKHDYSQQWANRMLLELRNNPKAIFLTLTYNDNSLSWTPSGLKTLNKRDVQLFWKRLRKAYPEAHIRYFLAGEYGPKTFRPHYHAIVYGLSMADFPDLQFVKVTGSGNRIYTSPTLESIWSNGFVSFSDVTWKTCAYVARYTVKKMGNRAHGLRDRVPEFTLSSRRPGIGLQDWQEYIDNKMETGITIPTPDGPKTFPVPYAILRKADREHYDSQRLFDLKQHRYELSRNKLKSDILVSGTDYVNYLKLQEKTFKARIKNLDFSRKYGTM